MAKEAQIERDVASVAELINGLEGADMRALAEQHGGTWERLTKDDPQAAGGAAAGTAQ